MSSFFSFFDLTYLFVRINTASPSLSALSWKYFGSLNIQKQVIHSLNLWTTCPDVCLTFKNHSFIFLQDFRGLHPYHTPVPPSLQLQMLFFII